MAAERILSPRVVDSAGRWPDWRRRRSRNPDHAAAPRRRPGPRDLGLGSAVLFVLGSVIGSGIFLTTGVMAAALPSPDAAPRRLGRRRRDRAERRPDLRGDGRDVSQVGRRLRLPARGVRSADRVPLRLGGAADLLQRRHRRRRGRLRRLRQLLRARALDRRASLWSIAHAARAVDGVGGADRRRHRRSSRSRRSTTSASAAATASTSSSRSPRSAGLAALPILALVASRRVAGSGRRSCRRIWRGRSRGSASR